MLKTIRLVDVMGWVVSALEAARNDIGDAGGDTTALSYRTLLVEFLAETGGVSLRIVTRNWGFSGYGERVHTRITGDGVEVTWEEKDVGIHTGADWLPQEFISWMKEANE